MKTLSFLVPLPLLILSCGLAPAQTNDNPPYQPPPAAPKPHVVDVPQPDQSAPSGTPGSAESDPAKIAEFQRRFDEGYALQEAGKLTEARAIYDGILADEPKARRSLLEAGRISFKLNELTKADEYLERLHLIEPDFPEAIELLIQINQALKHDVRVELLLRDFRELHDSNKIPELSQSLCFVRERFQVDTQSVVISQFFDYTQNPFTVWMAEVYDASGNLKRRLLLNYDAAATQALRAKDDKYANTQVFTWFEHVVKDGKVTAVNAYLQILALPDYQKFRGGMLLMMANPPKPIYSAPVDSSP